MTVSPLFPGEGEWLAGEGRTRGSEPEEGQDILSPSKPLANRYVESSRLFPDASTQRKFYLMACFGVWALAIKHMTNYNLI